MASLARSCCRILPGTYQGPPSSNMAPNIGYLGLNIIRVVGGSRESPFFLNIFHFRECFAFFPDQPTNYVHAMTLAR